MPLEETTVRAIKHSVPTFMHDYMKYKTFATNTVFTDVESCAFVRRYQSFGGTYPTNCMALHQRILLDAHQRMNPNLKTFIQISFLEEYHIGHTKATASSLLCDSLCKVGDYEYC
jgi:hypothetical protein